MKNLHILPTDRPSRLRYINGNNYALSKEHLSWRFAHHIYITSDEEIKEGDYYITPNNTVLKALGPMLINVEDYKKIILTTDQDLDGVQAIDDEFLEWFVKNPNCEEVQINDWMSTNGTVAFGGNRYQICNHLHDKKTIIPQEEPKQETRVFGTKDDKTFWSDKPIQDGHPDKQETLEEAAREYWKRGQLHLEKAADTERAFLRGGLWQAERMYSEEELREAFKQGHSSARKGSYNQITEQEDFDKWFKHFKKKA